MTKSGRKSNAQKSHRKVQSSSARNRKSVNKPLTKSTSAKKSQNRGVKASQVRSSRAKATIQKTIDSKQKEMKRESAILETSATTSEEPVSVEVKIENKKKVAAKSEPAETKEAVKVKNESAEAEEVAKVKNESAETDEDTKDSIKTKDNTESKDDTKTEDNVEVKDTTKASDVAETKDIIKINNDTEAKDAIATKDDTETKNNIKAKDATEAKASAQAKVEGLEETTKKTKADAKSKIDNLEEKIAKAKVIKHSAPRDVKINFVNEKVEKRPLSEKPVTMDVVQKNRIRHFSDVSEETVLAEMEQVGRTSSQSVALERALSNFEVEHPEVSDRPIIRDFDIRRVNERMDKRKGDNKTNESHRSAKEIKESAIRNAMNNVSKQEKEFVKHRQVKSRRVNFGFKRIMLALACATAAVFAIVYFVNINAPNVSLRVAAMQSGINASYPRYVPRDFNLSDITSEQGKITMNFKNAASGDAFSLVEENSAWDSTALLNNYVRDNYDDYTVIKEQGLTIYLGGRAACWVNGGIIYKLNIVSGSLTKKQITTIATSLIASN